MSRRVGPRLGGRAGLCLVSAAASALGLALLFGLPAMVVAQGGMALPGKFEATPTGAATYTVAIAVPPGTGGMVPSIALSYNSQGRNGLVGMGWHLEGLPSIGRCPRTIAQDGVRGSVNYDADDRFCLDGQRLVAVSGTYGADGTEYRTEIESFSKVVSRGTAGTGPAWFEVWTKSGQRMEFGNTTGSRVLAQGKPTARDWVVNKVADTAGNYFTVAYVNDTTNGQVYPDRIDYTGNAGAGLAPYNSVRFVYSTARPDVVPGYHLGSLQKTTVRLTNVQTYTGSTLVADYQLAYDQSAVTGRSRLTSVKLCHGGGACLPATTFAWQTGTTTPTIVANLAGQDGQLSGHRPYVADFNADGLPDIMWDKGGHSTSPSSSGTRVLWTGAGSGNFTVTGNLAGQNGTLSGYAPIIADFDRDGWPDILWYAINSGGLSTGALARWLNTGTGSFAGTESFAVVHGFENILALQMPINATPVWQLSPKGVPTRHRAGGVDVDGDSRTDIVWDSINTATIWITRADGSFSVTTSNGCSPFPWWDLCSVFLQGLDYNGDGLTDLFWLDTSSSGGRYWALLRGQGDGTFALVNQGHPSNINHHTPPVIDINGDGKSDILWDYVDGDGRSKGQRILWLGKGDGTFIEQTNVSGQDGTLSGYQAYPSDFNGDGLADILWVQTDNDGRSTGSRVLWLGKGDSTFTVINNFAGQDGKVIGYVPLLVDFNGDGKTDVLWDSRSGDDTRSTGTRVLWLSDGVFPDLMTSVTSGIGAKVTVTYKSMTDSSVYTKDTQAPSRPADVVDLQGAMALVSRVDATNAIGGTVSTGYAYAAAKADLNGRGFLGFRRTTITDLQTNIVSTTTYRQDYPYTSLVAEETKKLAAVTLNTTVHAYTATPLGGTRYQPSLSQSQAASADLDGSVLPTVTSTYKYDTLGNATQIVVSATDGHAKTTDNIYTNDTTKWLLGRLTRATVASAIVPPGPPPKQPATDVVISASTNNLNLWNYLLANGLAKAGTPGTWTVTIASNVVIGSTSASLAALDTGAFPAGSVLKIVNNGTIVGAGGKGGHGGYCDTCGMSSAATAGSPGGPALRAQVAVTLTNNGKIWGGGGGGRGGGLGGGGGGGGGAGAFAGAGGTVGAGAWAPTTPGSPGTLTTGGVGSTGNHSKGGNGGGPGLPGSAGAMLNSNTCALSPPAAGGAAGPAVIGNALITWAATGDRKGPLN